MAIRNYKPTTPGRRKMSTLINDEITKATPEKSLTVTLKKNSGRNNQGKITTRHQGGRVKRKRVSENFLGSTESKLCSEDVQKCWLRDY